MRVMGPHKMESNVPLGSENLLLQGVIKQNRLIYGELVVLPFDLYLLIEFDGNPVNRLHGSSLVNNYFLIRVRASGLHQPRGKIHRVT